jgi:hypothetical protein
MLAMLIVHPDETAGPGRVILLTLNSSGPALDAGAAVMGEHDGEIVFAAIASSVPVLAGIVRWFFLGGWLLHEWSADSCQGPGINRTQGVTDDDPDCSVVS